MSSTTTTTTTASETVARRKPRPKSESFHTLPREPFALISRKDIIRRTCSKSEEGQNDPLTRLTQSLRKRWRRSSLMKKRNGEEEAEQRPKTLPSICRRSSGKDRDAPTMTLVPMTRISRQEIIRRTSSTATEDRGGHQQRRKSCGSVYNGSQGVRAGQEMDSRHAGCFVKNTPSSTNYRARASDRWRSVDSEKTMQVPRPSTLPKIASSRHNRGDHQNEYANTSTRSSIRDSTNKQEAPIYGRIRRRKASVPNLANTSYSQSATRNGVGDSNSIGEATLSRARKTHRSIRDPASDPPNYGMLDYRSASGTSLPNLPQRTMSRRRIIDNAEESRVIKSLSRVKKDRKEDEKDGTMQSNTLPSTIHDHERARRRSAIAVQRNGHWHEPTYDRNRTEPPEVARRKINLSEDSSMVTGSSKSLPSYVKKARKASCIPLRIDRPRDDFASKSLNRITNGVKEGSGVSAVRKTSASGQSGAIPYSIFGLCTSRRKVQHPVSRTPSRAEDDGLMNPYRTRNPRPVRLWIYMRSFSCFL